jgi:hypothetical protein
LIRTIKEELCWLREWSSVEELKIEMEKFVEYFNDNYLHLAWTAKRRMCLKTSGSNVIRLLTLQQFD